MCNGDLFAIRQIVKQWTTMQHTTKGIFIIQPKWTRLLASQYHWCLLQFLSKLHNVFGILGSKQITFPLNHVKMDGMISFRKNVKNTLLVISRITLTLSILLWGGEGHHHGQYESFNIKNSPPFTKQPKIAIHMSSSFVLHKSCFDLQHYMPPLPPPCWFASFGNVIVLFVPSFLPCLDTGHSIAYE